MDGPVGRRWKCRACGGIYAHISQEVYEYYHVCPPYSEAEWRALPPGLQMRFHPGDNRPNHRDENVVADNRGRRRGIKHEGDGVDEL